MRILYAFLLRLHPRAFRERFAEEMLAIFDEAPSVGFLGDAVLSLVRQWMFRPKQQPDAVAAQPSGMFQTLDTYTPRRSALIQGAVLSACFFWALVLAATNGGRPLQFLIGSPDPRPGLLSVTRSSIEPATPDATVRVPAPAAGPWFDFASRYFKIIYVLGGLDTDHDYVISAAEIAAAPAALRQLDLDGDGKLTAEECGHCLGAGYAPGCRGDNGSAGDEHGHIEWSREQLERFRAIFMSYNPVLAALDTDHDAEISATEIQNAPAALKRLDLNGDGRLLSVEIGPESVVRQILMDSTAAAPKQKGNSPRPRPRTAGR